MENQSKKKSPLVLGIIAIAVGWIIPLAGLICGIIGLVLGSKYQKETNLDFNIEKILNIVGIVVSVLAWIYNVFYMMS